MAWAIITIYTSKFVKMDPQQLPKTSRFYSRCKMCDIKNRRGCVPHPPLGSLKVKPTNGLGGVLSTIRIKGKCKLVHISSKICVWLALPPHAMYPVSYIEPC